MQTLIRTFYWPLLAALGVSLIVFTQLTEKPPRSIPARIARSESREDLQAALKWYAKHTPITLAWQKSVVAREQELNAAGILNAPPEHPSFRSCLRIKSNFRGNVAWDHGETYRVFSGNIEQVTINNVSRSQIAIGSATLEALTVDVDIQARNRPDLSAFGGTASGLFQVQFIKGEYGYYLALRKEPFFPGEGCERLTFNRVSDEE